jgi:VWFA-related protein
MLWGVALLSVVALATQYLTAQEPVGAGPAAQKSQPTFTLRVQRNVVLVRVVVRDSRGRTVSGLQQKDFVVTDNGKAQEISSFVVETAPAAAASPPQPSAAPVSAAPAAGQGLTALPASLTYLAFYFDDLNSVFDSVVRSREAAKKFIAGLPPTERIAIFSSSGTLPLDFTEDRQKLDEALLKLHAVKRLNPGGDCPEFSDYLASQIVNQEDPDAYRLARDAAINDCHLDPRSVTNEILRMQAQAAYNLYVMQARAVFANLDGVVDRIALMPGERQVMLVSDGFMPLEMREPLDRVVDHALRTRVVISALDGAGLAVRLREADASQHYVPSVSLTGLYHMFDESRDSVAAGTLAEIAEGTGGQFFHNNNDLLGGLRSILGPPEVSYVLTFSPQRLNYNGAVHTVKVRVISGHGLTVQARRGYFAPREQESPEALAEEQIHEAVYSQEPIQGLPLSLTAEGRKVRGENEEISVQARLDVRGLPFEQRDDQSVDDVTYTVVLFDRDGKFVSGSQQNYSLALKKHTLEDLEKSGLSLQAHVGVKPGAYTVRVVVRESRGGQIAALSKTVEVPL